MSVVKSKRSQSSVDFEMLYFSVADNIDNMVEHCFYAEPVIIDKNQLFVEARCKTLERMTDSLLYYIKIANSIYPTTMSEYEERRLCMGRAIGTCYAILTNYQRIVNRLRVPDDKYTEDIKIIIKMINSLKAWRKSDNKIKERLLKK